MKKYLNLFLFFIICFLAVSIPQKASAYYFSRDLYLGISGSDVTELQKYLNSDPETQIAAYGAGSPGNETSYFGSLTKNAVIRFQNKYHAEILDPLGMTYGNGRVGPKTRGKLNNSVSTQTPIYPPPSATITPRPTQTTTPTPTPEPPSTNSDDSYPIITQLSDVNVVAGDKLTIYGTGFTATSKVFWRDREISSTLYANQGKIEVTAPSGNGAILIYILDGKKDTRLSSPVFTVVTDRRLQSPTPTIPGNSNVSDVQNVINKL